MKILGLIPARGGSKRLPRKNVRLLGGLPLIAWSVRSALASGVCADIVVSTDDDEIADLARGYGASVPGLRPAELASDTASSVDVALHALDVYQSEHGAVDGVLLLQPTSPFRTVVTIKKTVEIFAQWGGKKSVVTLSPAASHPAWTFTLDDFRLNPSLGWEWVSRRSQDLEPAYVLNGLTYLISPESLRTTSSFFSPSSLPVIVDDLIEGLDIDTAFDWMVAEAIVAAQAGELMS